MTQTLPPLTTEAAALSTAGDGLVRHEMGAALVCAGAAATIVIVEPGDDPGVSGVQDSTKVLLSGDGAPALRPRFGLRGALPIHVFARLDQGCLSLGAARCRDVGEVSASARFDHVEQQPERAGHDQRPVQPRHRKSVERGRRGRWHRFPSLYWGNQQPRCR